jgi:hypothetical protein
LYKARVEKYAMGESKAIIQHMAYIAEMTTLNIKEEYK